MDRTHVCKTADAAYLSVAQELVSKLSGCSEDIVCMCRMVSDSLECSALRGCAPTWIPAKSGKDPFLLMLGRALALHLHCGACRCQFPEM